MSFLPCCNRQSPENERLIAVNKAHPEYKSLPHGYHYSKNEVVTSKYTWWNFIFLNLYEQFSNLANVYFLLIGILQIIPAISTSKGLPTMYYPLAFIVVVSGVRAIAEDVTRHNADRKRNSYLYDVLTTDSHTGKTVWKPTKSGDLKVGTLIRLKKNEMIPSDMLLLGTSDAKGHCFIDKANLNGETKLEVYTSIRQTRYAIKTLPEGALQQDVIDALAEPPNQELIDLKLELEYELPNKRFDSFRGIMWLQSGPDANNSTQTAPQADGDVTDNNTPRPQGLEVRCSGHDLLMRETNLKNTEFIVGLIVYTGNDTKIQRSNLDGEKPKLKVSKIMRLVNLYLIWMFIFQCLLCVLCGILTGIWYYDNSDSWYLRFEDTTRGESIVVGVLAFFTWMINLSYLVPISLVVSAEMVKFIMSMFINSDVYLYHPVIKKPTHCNSSTIHEDLGLVNYICSDKTGTLTTNSMQFRFAMCSDTNEYGSKMTDIAKAVKLREEELQEREAGTWKPKPMPLWSDMVEKFHPPRKPNKKTGFDIECCNQNCCLRGRKCPNWCRFWFWSKKTFVPPGQKDLFASDDLNEEDIFAAVHPNVAGDSSNCFNKYEKRYLLSKLYRSNNQAQKEALEKYMLHMTLSNTVKPYYEGPKSDPILKFQPESAEELAMVQFALNCGFTKLPEKEENDKTEQEKRSGANTFISIQPMNPDTFAPEGEPKLNSYAFLAVFGFTSARARVTLIYQDISTGRILCMTKGQDTTVMPFITLEGTGTREDKLLSTLKESCDNGLRSLVAGHAEKSYEWWKPWGDKYIALKNQALDEKQRAAAEHELYEQIERDVGFEFLGCIGLEDQLQALVPETIQACLRANIKVWMITGDKLETARNIGLACNLIDSDMQPQIKASDSVQNAMSALEDSRLIEITGEWNQLFQNQDELSALFDIIDYNKDGMISVGEIAILMDTLHTGITEEKLVDMVRKMMEDKLQDTTKAENNNSIPQSVPETNAMSPAEPKKSTKKDKPSRRQQDGLALYDDEASSSDDEDAEKNRPSLPKSPSMVSQSMIDLNKLSLDTRDPRTLTVDKQSFIAILQKFERSPYEAILFDITSGLERYDRIQDHIAYPISMLVSRDAFLVMFPEQGGNVDNPRWPKPTPQQLEDLRRSFFFLASVSKSLIFARAQPSMKKKMVTEIQFRSPQAITLAIGDGANDTDMITAAHIGIGIAGVEGTAATNSADYAIGTFRMLHTLLFVHGFWSYQRVATLVNFIFYKAALLSFTQFLFGIYSGFSGQQFFNDFLLQIYNVIMTSLPIIVLAILDKHLPRQTAENNVVAYKEQQYQSFNFWVFALWIFRSLFHSVLLFFIPYICLFNENPFPSYGDSSTGTSTVARGTMDLWWFSTLVYYATTLLPSLNILFVTKSINFFNILVILLSILATFLLPWVFSLSFLLWLNPDMTGAVALMYASPTWWLTLIMTVFIPILVELSWQVLIVQYFPSLTQILQEKLYVIRKQEKLLNKENVITVVPSHTETSPTDTTGGGSATDLEIHSAKPKLTMKRKMTIIQPDGSVFTTNDGNKLEPVKTGTPLPPVSEDAEATVSPPPATTQTTTTTKPKTNAPVVRLERPVLLPEDEHIWLHVKAENAFTRSGLPETAPKEKESLVQSVIAHNKTQLISPTPDVTSPFESPTGPKKIFASRKAKQTKEQPLVDPEEAMRTGFVRALLRFRNQTGSIFDSAAQSAYHTTVEAKTPEMIGDGTMQNHPPTPSKPRFDDDDGDECSIADVNVDISFEESRVGKPE